MALSWRIYINPPAAATTHATAVSALAIALSMEQRSLHKTLQRLLCQHHPTVGGGVQHHSSQAVITGYYHRWLSQVAITGGYHRRYLHPWQYAASCSGQVQAAACHLMVTVRPPIAGQGGAAPGATILHATTLPCVLRSAVAHAGIQYSAI
jgi:hypothetical protein